MKTTKLIEIANEYLDADKQKQRKQRDSIKVILKKLKKKQDKLNAKLANEKSKDNCKKIQKNLNIVFAQRKKGLKILKSLKG
ncbi:MAG: hypothetical protein RPU64_12575 [Candidatus Sedimenticola sp. (ex Thyasira tokunagai)]